MSVMVTLHKVVTRQLEAGARLISWNLGHRKCSSQRDGRERGLAGSPGSLGDTVPQGCGLWM